jgi:hypothetical protein
MLRDRHPDFDQPLEIQFWLSYALFEQDQMHTAVREAQVLSQSVRGYFYRKYLQERSFDFIHDLLKRHSQDTELAKVLIKKAGVTDFEHKDMLDSLMEAHNVKQEEVGLYPDVFKESYQVGVFLPFMQEGRNVPDNFILEMYEGMRLASDWLKEKGIHVDLFPYDTRKDPMVTDAILQDDELAHLDLCIGPLYKKPIAVVRDFCHRHKINMLNPVSFREQVIDGSPSTYLMMPSYATMARAAAEYLAAYPIGGQSRIYYEDKYPEKEMARVFREVIEKHGFEVSVYEEISSASASKVHEQFSQQKRRYLYLTPSRAQEMREQGHNIKERRKYDDDGNPEFNADGSPKMVYYEMVSGYDDEGLDHMFVISKDHAVVNNFVGAAESSAVRVVGFADWLDFNMLSYDQLERLGAIFIYPDFIKKEGEFYEEVSARFEDYLSTSPGDYHFLGFESIWWTGHMLDRYGKYFQNGFYDEQNFPSLMFGHQYDEGRNDNATVPLVQFKEGVLTPINLNRDEEEQE